MINKSFYLILILGFMLIGCVSKDKSASKAKENIEQSVSELRKVLHTQSEWVKVHAAEFLIWSRYSDGIEEEFLREERKFGTKSQYRIGIWRVLAQVAGSPEDREVWVNKIHKAYVDIKGTDRIHAAETLAKLKISPIEGNPDIVYETIADTVPSLSLYTQWSVGYTSKDSLDTLRNRFFEFLVSNEKHRYSNNHAQLAYVLRQIGGLSDEQWTLLADMALRRPNSSTSRINIISAAYCNTPNDSLTTQRFQDLYAVLLTYMDAPEKGTITEVINALSMSGSEADLPLLIAILNNEYPMEEEADNADVKASAAYAILSILSRIKDKNS